MRRQMRRRKPKRAAHEGDGAGIASPSGRAGWRWSVTPVRCLGRSCPMPGHWCPARLDRPRLEQAAFLRVHPGLEPGRRVQLMHKPLDAALVEQLARHHQVLITIEEGSIGGFGSTVLQHLAWKGLLDHGLKVRPMILPDTFIDHDSQAKQLAFAKLSTKDIVAAALSAIGLEEALAGGQAITAR